MSRPGLDLSEDSRDRIARRDEEIRRDHCKPVHDLDTKRKRLVWRSKQRGWLEVDLLLGTWAVDNVSKLSPDELDQYERILNLETVDLFNLVAGLLEPPEELRGPVLDKLLAYAKSSPLGQADPAKYAREVKPKMAN